MWKILTVWEQPQALARCGLFHSAYSNSYVNLAIFKAGVDRELVKEDCGAEAEDLIYKFCGAWGARARSFVWFGSVSRSVGGGGGARIAHLTHTLTCFINRPRAPQW